MLIQVPSGIQVALRRPKALTAGNHSNPVSVHLGSPSSGSVLRDKHAELFVHRLYSRVKPLQEV